MTMIVPSRATCPNCKARCEVTEVLSAGFVGISTEMREITRLTDPLEVVLHACLRCGFTGDIDDFRRCKRLSAAVAGKIRQQIQPRLTREQPSADVRWEFAAMIAEWRGRAGPLEIAEMYRNAAWCAADKEREVAFRRTAAKWMERALEAGVPNRPVVLYLLGELYRRCGDTALADTWFDAAVAAATAPDEAWVRDLAIQQKTDPQEILSRAER